ncbi:unnamed protein product [Leptosia nina]|uniref:Uncharacterized protein n=1 Tax=Leptosia nina TaxID=320188 RepID=A0AAV1JNW3_9NEOP
MVTPVSIIFNLGMLAAVIFLARCFDDEPPIRKKIEEIVAFKNVSDDLILVDVNSFVREHGDKESLRVRPYYHDPAVRDTKKHTLDLMKQAIYGTQMRMRDLNAAIERFNKSVPFQLSFVFMRLEQLIIDMRRIFTLARRKEKVKRMYQHIILYEHLARKHVDVLYLVQFVIDTHAVAMKDIEKFLGPDGKAFILERQRQRSG